MNKNQTPFCVKVVTCLKDTYWYSEFIGEVFRVIPRLTPSSSEYVVVNDDGSLTPRLLEITDCELYIPTRKPNTIEDKSESKYTKITIDEMVYYIKQSNASKDEPLFNILMKADCMYNRKQKEVAIGESSTEEILDKHFKLKV